MNTLTMERTGIFSVRTRGDKHCGSVKTGETLDIDYKVVTTCAVSLDDRGFLFDQLTVQKYFEQFSTIQLSCEQLTMFFTKGLMEQIKKESPKCDILTFSLTLSPYPHKASMTYRWEKGQPKKKASKINKNQKRITFNYNL